MLQHHNLLEQMQVSSGGAEAEGEQRNQRLSAPQSAVSLRLSLRPVCGSVCANSFYRLFIRNRDVELINIICLNEHSFNKYINYTAAMAIPLIKTNG